MSRLDTREARSVRAQSTEHSARTPEAPPRQLAKNASTRDRLMQAIPPVLGVPAKAVLAWPRYWGQVRAARRGFGAHGSAYPQNVLFVAGLPKSGTTWLKKMLVSYPGFAEVMPAPLATYEWRKGESHSYELSDRTFSSLHDALVIMKLHVHGSDNNVRVLRDAGLRYVVLHRDLRDVAVSFCHYVKRTPWHGEHTLYRDLHIEDGLELFAKRTLPAYAEWVRTWRERRDPERSIEIRYEAMLDEPQVTLARVARLFELDASAGTIDRIIRENSFNRLSGGRTSGVEGKASFFRKGVAGDWKNSFTDRLRELYRPVVGDLLVDLGYEHSLTW